MTTKSINVGKVTGTAIIRNKINNPVVEMPVYLERGKKPYNLNMHLSDFLMVFGQVNIQIEADHKASTRFKSLMDAALLKQ